MISYLYFLKVILCSSIFLGYYFLVLRNKAYHQYNRFYLLIAIALSWSIPLLSFNFTVEKENVITPVYQVINFVTTTTVVPFEAEQNIVSYSKSVLTFDNFLSGIYCIISLIMLIHFAKILFHIFKLSKKYAAQNFHSYKLFLTKEENAPFSFFKFIFWNTDIDLQSQLGKQILQHELTHIEQKHSWDKIFVQLNLMMGWFNPKFWLMKKELEMIHEFIADKKSVPDANTKIFAQMLLNTAFSGKNMALQIHFFTLQSKED